MFNPKHLMYFFKNTVKNVLKKLKDYLSASAK